MRMSINLLYSKGTSEKLWCILKSHKIRSTYYTKNTLHKLLCKPKEKIATEHKNITGYEINCSNCEALYFSESKGSLKSQHKRYVKNCDCEHCWEQITTLAGIRRKLLIQKAG